jgi:hypothetical protein
MSGEFEAQIRTKNGETAGCGYLDGSRIFLS